jgi:hypothetical protein
MVEVRDIGVAPVWWCAGINRLCMGANLDRQHRSQLDHPLTMSDAYSRFLLECRGLPNTRCQNARPWFERAFVEYGLPNAARTDGTCQRE